MGASALPVLLTVSGVGTVTGAAGENDPLWSGSGDRDSWRERTPSGVDPVTFFFVIPASQEAIAGGIGKLLAGNVPDLSFYVTLMSAI